MNQESPGTSPSPAARAERVALPARVAALVCVVAGGLLLLPAPKWGLQVIPAVCLLGSGYGLSRGRRDAGILAMVLNLAWLAMVVADWVRVDVASVVAVAIPGTVIGGVLLSWRTLRADRDDHPTSWRFVSIILGAAALVLLAMKLAGWW